MTDLIFESYCINCEKVCGSSSIYCSSNCQQLDEQNYQKVSRIYDDYSPLLTPTYQEKLEDYKYEDIDEINLNYNLSTEPNYIISTSNNYKKWLNLLYAK